MNYRTENIVVLDIETRGYSEADLLDGFDPASVRMGVIKDPDKQKAKIAEARRALLEDAALDATTGTVLVCGLYDVGTDTYGIIESTVALGGERGVLVDLWNALSHFVKEDSDVRFVGFNLLAFDLPFLCRRSWHTWAKVPEWVFDGRYISSRFVDVLARWQCGNRQDTISLDRLARFVGFEGKKGSGKNFAQLYASNRTEALEYLKNDLKLTSQIALRMGV